MCRKFHIIHKYYNVNEIICEKCILKEYYKVLLLRGAKIEEVYNNLTCDSCFK